MVLSALYGSAPEQHCQTSGLAGAHVYMAYTMIVMAQIKTSFKKYRFIKLNVANFVANL